MTLLSRLRGAVSGLTADTYARIAFSLVTAPLVYLYEVQFAGLSTAQLVGIRILFNLLVYTGTQLRFSSSITDGIRRRLQGDSEHWLRRWIADGVSLWLYNLPLYSASAFIMRVTIQQVAFVEFMYLFDSIATGWINGWFLDLARRWLFPSCEKAKSEEKAVHS